MIARTDTPWVRVTHSSPCPVCGHDSWCTVSPDGTATRCKREQSDQPSAGADGDAWLHRTDGSSPRTPPPPREQAPGTHWGALASQHAAAITDEQVRELATMLGVEPQALRELSIGSDGVTWTFPMFDATGAVCGIRIRPKRGKKFAATGSRNGVFRARLLGGDGCLFVTEGESDAAAAMTLGYDAIGTPGAGQCASLVAAYARGRDVVVMADADAAGEAGAAKLVAALFGVARSVRVLRPADGHKDLRAWLLGGLSRDQIDTAIEQASVVEAPADSDTGEIVEEQPPAAAATPTFPVEVLPPVLRAMVTAGADAQGVDVAYWAVPLLGTMAGCVGATRRVRISDDWRAPSVVWCAIVAPSGAGKSPPLTALQQPVREHDHQLHLRTLALQKQYLSDLDAWKAGDPKSRGAPPSVPPMLGAIVSDCTLEALAVRLQDNPRGLLLAVDELAGWLKSHNRYRTGGGDEEAWLKIYNAQWLKVDRKGGAGAPARIYVKYAAVSIVGTIQPAIARKYLAGDEQRSSGMCARVLLAMPPVVAARLTGRSIPDDVKAEYGRVLRALLDLALDDEGEPVDLPLTADAYERFRVWHDRNGDACVAAVRAGDEDMASALAKLRSVPAQMALLVALARSAEDGTAALLRRVTDKDMAAGIAIADYHEAEARRIYASWDQDDVASQADHDGRAIQSLAGRLFAIMAKGERTLDELHTYTGKKLTGDRLRAGLKILEQAGKAVGEMRPSPRGGRPREVWSLLPDPEPRPGGVR